MSENNVVKFYRKDSAIDPDAVLEQAIGRYQDVLILGYDKAGRLDVAATLGMTTKEAVWVMAYFKQKLMNGDYGAEEDPIMNYWRCKCGKSEKWESGMPPRPCEGCDECGTTFATHATGHMMRAPHNLEIRYDTHTGKPSHKVCTECWERFELTDEEKEDD